MNSKTYSHLLFAAGLGLSATTALSQTVTTVADFELGQGSNLTGGFWYYVDDAGNGGNSVITSGDTASKPPLWNEASVGPGNAGSQHAAKLGFTFGDKMLTCGPGCTPYAPEVLIGTDIRNTGDSVANLSGATRMSFFAKAEPPLSVTVVYVSADITDYSYFRRTIQVTRDWKEFNVLMEPSTNMSSPGWGQSVGKTPNWAQAKAFNFSVSKSLNSSAPSAALYIDDVKIHNWALGPSGVIRAPAGKASHMASRLVAGGQVRFAIPEAYRKASGKVAVVDLSGKELAQARFDVGQAALELSVPRTIQTAFVRILAD
jgi:hypothetical protein